MESEISLFCQQMGKVPNLNGSRKLETTELTGTLSKDEDS